MLGLYFHICAAAILGSGDEGDESDYFHRTSSKIEVAAMSIGSNYGDVTEV